MRGAHDQRRRHSDALLACVEAVNLRAWYARLACSHSTVTDELLHSAGGFKLMLHCCSPAHEGRPFTSDLEVAAVLHLACDLLLNNESNQKQLVCMRNVTQSDRDALVLPV